MLLPPKRIRVQFLLIAVSIWHTFLFSHDSTISSATDTLAFYVENNVASKRVLLHALQSNSNKRETIFHLFSHGRSGELHLNGKWLNANQIVSFLENNKSFSVFNFKYLNIYGCDFASGKKGKQAIAYIQKQFNIKVNASVNRTGKDGDWLLELGNYKFEGAENYVYTLQNSPEICNDGIDNDGDGYIDGFDDDCIPAAPECMAVTEDAQNFFIEEKAKSQGGVTAYQTPYAADIDGDGDVEIVAFGGSNAYIYNGATMALEESFNIGPTQTKWNAGAIAQLDGAGYYEVLMLDTSKRLRVARRNSTGIWSVTSVANSPIVPDNVLRNNPGGYGLGANLGLADFDGDGSAEAYIGSAIYNIDFPNATGPAVVTLLGIGNNTANNNGQGHAAKPWPHSFAYDILPDNACTDCEGLELIAGNAIYAVNETTAAVTIIRDASALGTYPDGPASIADMDLDGDVDVVINADNKIYIWDPAASPNGVIVKEWTRNGGQTGVLNISNFYNDDLEDDGVINNSTPNVPEFTDLVGTTLTAYNHNNTNSIWTQVTSDVSSATSLTSFDFNGDGIDELVYRDQSNLRIMYGGGFTANSKIPSGVEQSSRNYGNSVLACSSATGTEHPIVVDANGDGEANIVVACTDGVKLFGSDASRKWQPARAIWNQQSYNVVNINDDGTLPINLQSILEVFPKDGNGTTILNEFNNQLNPISLVVPEGNTLLPDLTIKNTQFDNSTVICPSFSMVVEVGNDGDASVTNEIFVNVYDSDPEIMGANLLGSGSINQDLAKDESQTVTINFSSNSSNDSVFVVVSTNPNMTVPIDDSDFDNGASDCDVDNNILEVNLPNCCSIGASTNGTPTASDSDGDGINNSCDLDDDNDGILDFTEDCRGYISQNTDGNWIGTSSSVIDVVFSHPTQTSTYTAADIFTDGQVGYYINSGNRGAEPAVTKTGSFEYKVTFTPGVPAKEIAFHVRDFDNLSSPGGSFDITINGGTPAGAVFENAPGITYVPGRPPMNYNGSTSKIDPQQGAVDDQEIIIHGVGTTLITELVVATNAINAGDWLGYSLLGRSFCDSDQDGLRNQLDLDSDGDGCPDALEGSGSYTTANLQTSSMSGGNGNSAEGPVTQNLGTTVDTNTSSATYGVPIVSPATTASSQSIGSSQDAAVESDECSDCLVGASTNGTPTASDSDGDGINDICDLDDDNDGILDLDEDMAICSSNDMRVTSFNAATHTHVLQGDNGEPVTLSLSVTNYNGETGPFSFSNETGSGDVAAYHQIDVLTNSMSLHYTFANSGTKSNENTLTFYPRYVPKIPSNVHTNIDRFSFEYDSNVFKAVLSDPGNYVTGLNTGDIVVSGTTYQETMPVVVSNPYYITLVPINAIPPGYITSFTWNQELVNNTDIRVEGPGITITQCSYTVSQDIDGDGIINSLDLDSDGDGCPDALEGGGSYANANLQNSSMPGGNGNSAEGPVTQNLGTTVDTNATSATYGVPIVSPATTATNQTVGSSQDAAIESAECNDCIVGASTNGIPTASDSDGDGVNDTCDLDDDNDGILDENEGPCYVYGKSTVNLERGTIANAGATIALSSNTNYIAMQSPSGATSPSSPMVFVNGHDTTSGESFFTYTYDTPKKMYVGEEGELKMSYYYYARAGASTSQEKYASNPTITLNTLSGTYSGTYTFTDADKTALGSGNWVLVEYNVNGPANTLLEITSFKIKTEAITSAANSTFNPSSTEVYGVAAINFEFCQIEDTDGDGIPNPLDLDSDGDGCPDALEGGGSYTNANLQNSSMPGGNSNVPEGPITQNLGTTVNTNATSPTYGVPIVSPATTATNQTVGSSQDAAVVSPECDECIVGASTDGTPTASDSDGDGVNDVCDLDDDNDGILDLEEECKGYISQNTDGNWKGESTSMVDVTRPNPNSFGSYTFNNGQIGYYIGSRGGDLGVPFDGSTEYLVTFSPAVPVNEIAFYIRDYDHNASYADAHFEVSINGGTPAGNIFIAPSDINYLLTRPGMEYDASSSKILPVGSVENQNLMITGVGTTLITELKIKAVGLRPGDTIIYSLLGKSQCDSDNDGIPNQLDLDSDGDGCPDAIEGGGSFGSGDLVDSAMPGGNTGASYTGTSASPVITNLGTTVGDTPTTLGVPTVAGAGQGVGTSQITGATIQISEAPEDVSQCISDNVSVAFSATATSNPTTAVIGYQWQVSTDNGASFSAIIPGASGATAGGTNSGAAVTLTLTDVDVSYSGNVYKIIFAAADNACSEEATAVLELKNNPLAEAGDDQIIDCITTFVSIGDATADPAYSYSWMPTDGLSDPTSPNPRAEPLTTQTYVLTVTDDVTGCTSTDEVTVTVNNEVPTANAGADQRIDCETTSVILGVEPTDGYRYEWIPATGLSDASLSNPEATPREDTTYTVTVTNEETGCFSTDEVVVTVQGELPPADAGADQIIDCTTTSVTLGAAGADGYTYSWEPATALTNAAMAQPVANPSETTTYTLTVTNTDTGCASSDTVVVRVNAAPPVADAGADQIIDCNTTSVTLGTAAIEGYTYSWRPAAGLSDASIANPIATPTVTTTYTVTVTDTATGCTTEDEVVITENKTDEIQRENLSICIIDEPVDLNRFFDTPTFSGVAFPETEITWVLEESDTEISTMFNPNDYELGTYTATSTLEQGGCTLERRLTIRVHKDCIYTPCISSPDAISVSSLVTPNGDFVNDTFAIDIPINADSTDDCNISVHLQIYNRWGNLVYENTNYQNDWTGEAAKDALGDKEKSPRATYYYIIELENSGIPPKQGYFLLGLSR